MQYGDCETFLEETLQDEKAICMSLAAGMYAGKNSPDGETFLPEHLRFIIKHPPIPGASEGSWGSDYRSGLVSVLNFLQLPSDEPPMTNFTELPSSRYFPVRAS